MKSTNVKILSVLGLGAVILAPVAVGVGAPAAAAQARSAADGNMVTAAVNPAAPRVGDNTLDVTVTDSGGKPATGLKLSAQVEMTSMNMGSANPDVKELGNGKYQTTVNFSMAGPWRVTLRSAAAKAVLNFDAGSQTPWKSDPIPMGGASSPAKSTGAKPGADISGASMAGMDMSGGKMDGMNMAGGGMNMSGGGMKDMTPMVMPQLQEQGSYTVTGNEDWKVRTGFGKNTGMVGMMSQMMVGGSGMEGMKMAPMKMEFGEKNYTEEPGDQDGSAAPAAGDASMPGMNMGGMNMGAGGAPKGTGSSDAQPAPPADKSMSGGAMPGMTMTPAQAQALKTPAATAGAAAKLKIAGSIVNPKYGDNALTITVTDAAGAPVTGAKITTSVAMTSMDMGTTHPQPKDMGNGRYKATANFSMSGPWRVAVTATPPGGGAAQKAAFDFNAK